MTGGHGQADGGVRIDQLARAAQRGGDGGGDLGLVGAAAGEQAGHLAFQREAAGLGEGLHPGAGALGVAALELEQQALEVAGDLDVHGRAGGGDDRAALVAAGGEEAGQDVVLVGGDDKPRHRQADRGGDPAGIDVAEIAGRHGEGDRAGRGRPGAAPPRHSRPTGPPPAPS